MPIQFSNVEQKKLYISWLAWKNIASQEFHDSVRPLLNQVINDVEAFIKKCEYTYRLRDVSKVGFTLQPTCSFGFSPIKKGYFINVWSFFFCLHEADIFFRPSFLLANELVHEYAHYRFWQEHDMLGKDKVEMEQFKIQSHLENEKYALTNEVNFLKRIRNEIPNRISIKLFHVKSWENNGTPLCEAKLAKMPTRENIKHQINSLEIAIKGLSPRLSYDNKMTKQAIKNHSTLSSILKLDLTGECWPVVEMEI